MRPLKIAILPENGKLSLVVDSPAGLLQAGARLARGPKMPDIAFTHDDPAEAVADCIRLQKYVDSNINNAPKK